MGNKRVWQLLSVITLSYLVISSVLFFTAEQGWLDYALHFYYSIVLALSYGLIRIVRKASKKVRVFSWIVGAGLLFLVVPQLITGTWFNELWNLSLACVALLAGTVMYATIGVSVASRAFSIFLTLCVVFVMVMEMSNPLIHKIALGVFVAGALACLDVIVRSDAT